MNMSIFNLIQANAERQFIAQSSRILQGMQNTYPSVDLEAAPPI